MFTALMVTTFVSAIAINKGYYSVIAWIVLLTMNYRYVDLSIAKMISGGEWSKTRVT